MEIVLARAVKASSRAEIGTDLHFSELHSSLAVTLTMITDWFYLLWKMLRTCS
jgi:hypothetical protein